MEAAYRLAEEAGARGEVPIGALVVRDGLVVGSGSNTKEASTDPTAHAELLAIRAACHSIGNWRLSGAILITTLEPCPMCLAAAQQARIKALYYGATDLKGGALSLNYTLHSDSRLNHQFEVHSFPYEPARKILTDFFRARRNEQ